MPDFSRIAHNHIHVKSNGNASNETVSNLVADPGDIHFSVVASGRFYKELKSARWMHDNELTVRIPLVIIVV